MRLRVLQPVIRRLDPPKARKGGSAEVRAPESVRTRRRLKLWTRDPHCQACRALVDYPWGFELDHTVPLHQGGPDTEENSQVLCIPCHRDKTRAELGHREVRAIGIDGWPESGGTIDRAKA
jgi:5-methylcytosine-specific restriction protein A